MASSGIFTYKILSGGSAIDDTIEVLSIRVELLLNKLASAEIVIKDGQPSEQTFEATDADTFKPGTEIEIQLGYDSTNEKVFSGIVTKQAISLQGSGTVLTVTCKDKWIKSTVGSKLNAFESMTSSAMIEKIAGNYGLEKDVTSTSFEHAEYVQYKTLDWDLILNLSEREGMVVFTDNGKLTVAAPNISGSADVEIQFGSDVLDFNAEVNSSHQAGSLTGKVWDMDNQEIVSVSAAEPSLNDQGNLSATDLADVLDSPEELLVSATPLPQDGIQAWADASLLKIRLSGYTGYITCEGNSDVTPNSLIKLKGFGDRFNGDAFVSGVTHIAENGHWQTEVNIGLDPKFASQKADTSPPEIASSIPSYQSLQIGTVKAVVEDPDNNFRIQIELPFLDSDDQQVWARMASPYTGNSFGSFFLPEIDSEVVVAFVNNDPSFGIILGSLYSSKIPAPLTPSSDSDIKILKTKSGMEMSFDDTDGKVIMSLKTPNGNSIVMSEEDKTITITDQNSNEIKMAEDKVSITSNSKMEITASDELTISGSKVSIKGDDSVNISGGKIEASSDGNVEISAGGTADLSASGTMSVSGASVNLN